MSDENYADHPKTIGEIRSERDWSSTAWSPRDALIAVLRDIDSGKLNPDCLVVCIEETQGDRSFDHYFCATKANDLSVIGLLEKTKYRILSDA